MSFHRSRFLNTIDLNPYSITNHEYFQEADTLDIYDVIVYLLTFLPDSSTHTLLNTHILFYQWIYSLAKGIWSTIYSDAVFLVPTLFRLHSVSLSSLWTSFHSQYDWIDFLLSETVSLHKYCLNSRNCMEISLEKDSNYVDSYFS